MADKTVKEFEVHPYVQFMMDHYSPYRKWIESEGIPIVSGSYVADVRTVELGDWKRRGGKGAFLSFSDQLVADGYVCEIPRGGNVKPQRQLYEEIVLIAAGRGATTIWVDGFPKRTFEWERGSVFAIPLNAWHQHFNASGTEPARYVALTSAPVAFELYRDPEFIFGTSYMFQDRFNPDEEDFFTKQGKYHNEYYGGILHSNFIADIRKINLVPREKRGKGTRNMYIHMAGSAMLAHVSQFPVGRYKKAHRHGADFHVTCIAGTGYSLLWYEGDQDFVRVDWKHGVVFAPPDGMYHQHFNTSSEPARYLAIALGGLRYPLLAEKRAVFSGMDVNVRDGGAQIEYEDQDPRIHRIYLEELKKNRVQSDMGGFIDEK